MRGSPNRALRVYEQALEIARRLAARESENPAWLIDVGRGFEAVGMMLRLTDNLEGASHAYEQAIGIWKRLAEREPENQLWLSYVLANLGNLAIVLSDQGNLEGGLRACEQALEVCRGRLGARAWEPADWVDDVAHICDQVGDDLRKQGNLAGARRAYEQTLEIRQRLAEREPDRVMWQKECAVSQFQLASILAQGSRVERDEAVKLLGLARSTLLRFAASSDLTYEQKHKVLPAIEIMLRDLNKADADPGS